MTYNILKMKCITCPQQPKFKASKALQIKQIFKFIKSSGEINSIFSLPKFSKTAANDSIFETTGKQVNSQNQVAKLRSKFLKYFRTESSDDFLISYLERLQSVKVIIDSPILELACYIYAKIFNELEISKEVETDLEILQLLTFGVSLNIAQKYHFDRDIHPDSIQKLLGIKKRQLYQREIFVLTKIFDCCFRIDEKEFEMFSNKLYSL